jgi:8-oxo-dGTP pyrophosphatase MutT (NUDIX family)
VTEAADANPLTDPFGPPRGRGGPQQIPRPAGARPGGPAPWSHLPAEVRAPSIEQIRSALSSAGPPQRSIVEGRAVIEASDVSANTRAAVLAPLYEHDGDTYVILTRRTMQLRSHSGQVSFPGGRQEPGESLHTAALRESCEEIGLDASTVEFIGELDHLATITAARAIVPYVGVLPGRPERLTASPAEVDAILHVRLGELCDPAIFREEIWPLPTDHPIFFFELVGDTVWGATAAMLRQLLGFATGTLGRGDMAHF